MERNYKNKTLLLIRRNLRFLDRIKMSETENFRVPTIYCYYRAEGYRSIYRHLLYHPLHTVLIVTQYISGFHCGVYTEVTGEFVDRNCNI